MENIRARPRIWDLDWLVLRRQAQAIRGLLADPALALRDARVLDFGCGDRPVRSLVPRRRRALRGRRHRRRARDSIRQDGTLGAESAAYDLVTSFQVLEHVWDLAMYLGEARRVLRAEGWLLLSTHGSLALPSAPAGLPALDRAKGCGARSRRTASAWCGCAGGRSARVDLDLALLRFRAGGAAHSARRRAALGGRGAGGQPACVARGSHHAGAITADNACVYVGLFRRECVDGCRTRAGRRPERCASAAQRAS